MTDDLESEPAAPAEISASDKPESDKPESDQPPRLWGIVGAVGVLVLLADQLSKWWAVRNLSDGHMVDIVGSLRWNLSHNPGVAFSLGSDSGLGPWIAVLAIGVVAVVSFGATSRYRLGAVAAGLIAGGALGNLLDRAFRGDGGFLHGAVVDFIDLQFWPIFNIADSAVVVGAILLVIASFRMPQ